MRDFCQNNGAIFQNFLKEALLIVLFEDSRNIWIFQKVLHSTIVIVNQQGCLQELITDLMNKNEPNEERKKQVLEQIFSLVSQVPLTKLDLKSKEVFG